MNIIIIIGTVLIVLFGFYLAWGLLAGFLIVWKRDYDAGASRKDNLYSLLCYCIILFMAIAMTWCGTSLILELLP